MMKMNRVRRRRAMQRAALCLCGIGAGLILAECFCRIMKSSRSREPEVLFGTVLKPHRIGHLEETALRDEANTYLKRSETLGWTVIENALGGDGLYRSNGLGIRIDESALHSNPEETPQDPGHYSIAVFGGSFTHCDEVAYNDSWPSLLENLTERRGHVHNAGVPGYGTDQALLRYRELATKLKPNLVILGLAIPQLKRNVNMIRLLVGEWTGWTKPRFVLEGDFLHLRNSPTRLIHSLPRQGDVEDPWFEDEYFYDSRDWTWGFEDHSDLVRFFKSRIREKSVKERLYSRDSEPTRITLEIVKSFAQEVEDAGSDFLCLLICDHNRLPSKKRTRWQPLVDQLIETGIPIVDPTPELVAIRNDPDVVAPHGHYLRRANVVIAREVQKIVRMKIHR